MLEKIVLIGPPGAGKSSIGRALAKELLLPFIDSDGEIEKSAGKKISEIFVDDGEPHFRALEMEKVKELLQELLLINPRQQWMNLMSERRPIYEKLATDTVSSDSKKPHEVAKIIVEKIKAKI
jgi:shikimate kinase